MNGFFFGSVLETKESVGCRFGGCVRPPEMEEVPGLRRRTGTVDEGGNWTISDSGAGSEPTGTNEVRQELSRRFSQDNSEVM